MVQGLVILACVQDVCRPDGEWFLAHEGVALMPLVANYVSAIDKC